MYVEGPHPLYISYASPGQKKQGPYQGTLEGAGDQVQLIDILLTLMIHNGSLH